jgi:AcrR family transcriptional regulator
MSLAGEWSPRSLRERKKDATRVALSRTTLQLSKKRGFDNVTVEEIVEAAGVSRRTFFRYFQTKADAVFDGYAERLTRFRARVASERGAAFTRIRAGLLATSQEYAEEKSDLVSQYRIVQSSPVLAARELELDRGWHQAFEEVLRGEHPPYEARVFAGAILGVVRAALGEWFEKDGKPDVVTLGVRALDLLERGVVQTKARGTQRSKPRR